jgi:hypothetical protein
MQQEAPGGVLQTGVSVMKNASVHPAKSIHLFYENSIAVMPFPPYFYGTDR